MDVASNSSMYKSFSAYYDHFYRSKDYERETTFIQTILSKCSARTVLDVGCGTGTHLARLEQCGFVCEGLDFNAEMVEIARGKVAGRVFQGDMRDFASNKKYDAITSMFAVFNHNLTLDDARKTLSGLKASLNRDGILLLDLYNPQSSGEKVSVHEDVTRLMKWHFDPASHVCESVVTFLVGDRKVSEEKFPLRIYSIFDMRQLLEEAGFGSIHVYSNYTFEEASQLSKNLLFVAQ